MIIALNFRLASLKLNTLSSNTLSFKIALRVIFSH